MIKKLLNQIFFKFSHENEKKRIEEFLSRSTDLADLENRMRELDKRGSYNKYYF